MVYKKHISIREFTPPIVKDFYKKHLSRYGWFGNYASWEEAKRNSIGYNSNAILKRVGHVLLKVKNNEPINHLDSSIFKRGLYFSPVLAALLLAKEKDCISVLDFGGALGTTYFQNKKMFKSMKKVKWSIVEQKQFVEFGKRELENDELKFYYTIEECLKKETPTLLILSSVLQYLEKPYKFLEEILEKNFKYILIDRTPFVDGADRITVQKVNPKMYNASYPCRFFNERSLKKLFLKKYIFIEEFICSDNSNIPSKFKGFIFRRK